MALKSIEYNGKKFNISYEILNFDQKKNIVILHGWGASKQIMKNVFGNYLKDYKHIYVDLPGFGKSLNDYVLTTEDYVGIVDKLLKEINLKKNIIMGHSYGGKVATRLKPENLILLSSAGILEEKSFKIKIKIFFAKLLNKLGLKKVGKIFRSKDVSTMSENMYETFKNVVNEDFSEDFKDYNGKALIFWGKNDAATSLKSGKKIASLIKKSFFKQYDGDHFFFVKNVKDIVREIENGIS